LVTSFKNCTTSGAPTGSLISHILLLVANYRANSSYTCTIIYIKTRYSNYLLACNKCIWICLLEHWSVITDWQNSLENKRNNLLIIPILLETLQGKGRGSKQIKYPSSPCCFNCPCYPLPLRVVLCYTTLQVQMAFRVYLQSSF